ncbi:thyroid adenoma-associated protein homolog [Phoenix dactylifera]|uniref:Thyroid adenoma-associated protein homolog n=1 Tax=Phoenix dactylifera TaxID=42345 RepID=A0A8B7BS88_PHODC|nr:thyroid adenoma-associated protein homolog [Phoenix dactylifera]
MSAKWRALQHRHRYTYSSVVFPKPFVEALNLVPSNVFSSVDFFSQLKHLISLNSTYSQVPAVKDLSSAFSQLLATPEIPTDIVSTATRLYLEILFLENSLPLHRTLISSIAKSWKFLSVIDSCFVSLCEEYGDLNSKGRKRFLVSRAALSLISYPKLGFLNETMEKCSGLAAMDVAVGLEGVISDIESGSRPSPVVMEQCQEAMSCLYYLLQRFPSRFLGLEEGSGIFGSVIRTILGVLKSSAFSRDCLVAAGVSFCAAIQTRMEPRELSAFISSGFFGFNNDNRGIGDLGMKKVLPDGDLYLEMSNLSVLSRICLLRGILTAIPRNLLNTRLTELTNCMAWTVLYNGILPGLCKYCENPIDSHFNFHALTVMQICLQQIKTSILAELTDFSGDYEPLPEDMISRILRIIWNNLEDPLSQTVKQVHLIFDLLLDIGSSLPSVEGNERYKSLLCNIAGDLLHLGTRCKGRYVPLASLTKRLGAKTLLELNPDLLFETAYAYIDDDVCCAATSFLKCFLECLRDECWSHDGIDKGYDSFREFSLPPLLHGLISGNSKLRSNLNTYALPVILDVDTDSIFPMLAFISVGPSIGESRFNMDLKIDHCVAALVSLLKVSRSLALLEGDIDLYHDSLTQQKNSDYIALVCIKGINVRIPVEWLILALAHADDSLRIDAAESLFLNPKTSSLPSSLELSLMKEAVPLNMRCSSTAFQMKWTSLFRKFFSRVRTALERQVKQGLWQPTACSGGIEDSPDDYAQDAMVHRARDLFQFMKWLSCFLFYSCYPSAPYERKIMAMELILIMIDVWPPRPPQGTHLLYPYSEGITSSDSTLSLVGSIIDSWDRLRENSFRILLCFPTPLPGISSNDSVNHLIRWAKRLVCSPRVRESDAGALTFRLIFKKYVLDLGWIIGASGNVVCVNSQTELMNGDIPKTRSPVVEYISSLIEWLYVVVEEGEKDLSEACRNSFVHGVLLTLRYTFEELNWNSEAVLSSCSEMRCLLEKLLELIMRVTKLALWVVSADAWCMPYDMDDMVDDAAFLSEVPLEMDPSESLSEPVDSNLKSENDVRPAEQVVMVGCWLAMKEVSLLLGTIIRKIPLPSCTLSDSSSQDYPHSNADDIESINMSDGILDLVQLETIGNHFLQVLLKMKHNGAIDKTRAGFTALCNRLLCSNVPRLCKLTDSWMEQLMERTTAKGQSVDDLLRRSAGIPAAFIALFLSEPEGTPKKLLPRALQWLIDVANKSLCNAPEDGDWKTEVVHKELSTNQNDTALGDMKTETHVNIRASKIRDKGVVPTVHAFNVLRAAFNDTNLAADTSGFCSDAMIVSIRSFSSPYWEVRNGACLAYTALVRRMIGFLNVQKRQSARRALTGLEFFHRYPALHPFLFSELKIATAMLRDACSGHMESNMAKSIHPSLCPVLILLSRLKPSLISSGMDDALDPFLLMPFIWQCATQSNLRVRVLASRALIGLVSNDKLQTVINEVVHGLPHGRHSTSRASLSANMSNGDVTTATSSASMSANMSNSDISRATCAASFNSIHGLLLQLSSLLDNNCRNLIDIGKKDQILGELIKELAKCSWIGSINLCPCPTLNSSYLRVLDLMLDIARTYTSQHLATIQTFLLELASECLGAENSFGLLLHDPTKLELRRQAASSYFSCLLGGIPEAPEEDMQLQRFTSPTLNLLRVSEVDISPLELQERIMSCISDSTYEVRIATLKGLLRLVKSMKVGDGDGIIYKWARPNLQPMLTNVLFVEENPKCVYYVLRIIFNWNILRLVMSNGLQVEKLNYIGTDCDSAFCLWDRLVHLNSTMMRAKTREIILCCMGICVKQFVELLRNSVYSNQHLIEKETTSDHSRIGQAMGWAKALSSINSFISLVKRHSSPSEPVSMRKATAEAIVASGLLEETKSIASFVSNSHIPSEEPNVSDMAEKLSQLKMLEVINFYAFRILDIWFTCIQLLEDEDVGLRQRLAKNVQKCINFKGLNGSLKNDAVPTQVDRVIESSFEFLSSVFSHWLGYFNYLSRLVLSTAISVSSCRDLVRRIFDKEIDNHHEEKLLICQICCSHLQQLSTSKPWMDGVDEGFNKSTIKVFIQSWRLGFLCQLISFIKSFLNTEERTDWIGGIGNHKDAFVSIYANLLGLYALTQCPHEDYDLSAQITDTHKVYVLEFVELRELIRPFLRNPLISNLYFLVIQSHEKMLGVSQTPQFQGGYSVWDGFDPYFLLR